MRSATAEKIKPSKKLRGLELFAGIGGMTLGFEMAYGEDYECVAFVERDKYCGKVLNKHWSDVPIYTDIREFDYDKEKDRLGRIDIDLGGFPCQPWSGAGKQRGAQDDRDLWPEMLRVIKSITPRPRWIIGENVQGFVNMEMGLSRTVSDLENENYQVQPFVYGAVAVQARHQRQRCFVVAHSKSD